MPFKVNPPKYFVWATMKDRCQNPNNAQYKDYGGRGISVCERWQSYKAFAEDMLPSYREGLLLDRIDNDAGYSPENCKWSTRREQQMNRRNTVFVEIEGVRYKAADLSRKIGKKTDTIIARAEAGLSLEEVMSPERRYNSDVRPAVEASVKASRSKTHCKHGHEFTPENTRISPEGWRNCRACNNAKMRRRNAAKRGEAI